MGDTSNKGDDFEMEGGVIPLYGLCIEIFEMYTW